MMAEVLVSPDAVALYIAWLTAELPEIPEQSSVGVYRAIPSPRPTAFVTVRLSGGTGRDDALPVVDRPLLEFQCWAATPAAAHDLAQNARAVVLASKGVVLGSTQVYRVEDAGPPVDEPDPLSDQPRFTFRAQPHLRIRRPS
jgi:hypothetical protein